MQCWVKPRRRGVVVLRRRDGRWHGHRRHGHWLHRHRFRDTFLSATSVPRKKKRPYVPWKNWLFDRDPYHVVYFIIPIEMGRNFSSPTMSPTNQGQVGQAKRRWCGWYLEIRTECDYGNNTLTEGWWPGLWPKQLSDKNKSWVWLWPTSPKKPCVLCTAWFLSSKMKTPSWCDKWRSICMNHY